MPFFAGERGQLPCNFVIRAAVCYAVWVGGVMMEGPDLVESVAIGSFPVDGREVTDHLCGWIGDLRSRATLQAVVLGGITIAGLGVVDVAVLAERLGLPVLIATRRDTGQSRVCDALRAAGFPDRIPVVARAPRAVRVEDGLYVAATGIDARGAAEIVKATRRKARLPEPLRIAHLVARAMVTGESRGRV